MELTEQSLRDLEARILNLEVRDQPVSKHDLEKRWVAVRETLDAFSMKLAETELSKRGLNDTVIKVLDQQAQLLETLVNQSVQIQNMQEQLNTTTVRLQELLEELEEE